jgi:hypothetical protein
MRREIGPLAGELVMFSFTVVVGCIGRSSQVSLIAETVSRQAVATPSIC